MSARERADEHALRLASSDSLVVFAPHPDDETLGAGGLLQRAHAAGARVHVVVVTNGEDNPWPQRLFERRLRIGSDGRRRLARRRRSENDRALAMLRLRRATRTFLAVRDRGVTAWLLADASSACAAFASVLRRHRPTIVVAPSLEDRHPDHSAVGLLVELALATEREVSGIRRLVYSIHRPPSSEPTRRLELSLSREERERKRAAIAAYESQLVLRGPFYRSFAGPTESFEEGAPARPIEDSDRRGRRALMVGIDFHGRPFAVACSRAGQMEKVSGEIVLPLRRAFFKTPSRWSLFDARGWREARLPDVAEAAVRARAFAAR
jgi:LmbE family N-acetylglucosaminyl deacetylase